LGDLLNPSFLTLNRVGDVLYTVHGDHHEVSAFRVDRTTGLLTWLNTQDCQGKNPVHLALDPTGRHMVVSNHITGTLAVLPVTDDGALLPVSQLVTLEGKLGPHRVAFCQAPLQPILTLWSLGAGARQRTGQGVCVRLPGRASGACAAAPLEPA
jgi:6-phosphogluconolactonase (cycloisomerase 2 family)